MTALQAAILGIVQGITEFLPISSSGHLVLLQRLWHMQGDSLLFVTCLHVGTLIAVVWALRHEVRWLVTHPWSRPALMVIVALVPTAIIGICFEDLFEELFSSPVTVGFEFIITGVVLWWMDGVPKTAEKTEETMKISDALWVGVLQGAAIMPALSRSGLTIAGGLWRGMSREAAGRFSFLLSIPAILGATLLEVKHLFDDGAGNVSLQWNAIWIGTLASVVAGYLAVKGTLWLLQKARMRIFAIYVWALAIFVLADQLVFHKWFPPLLHHTFTLGAH